jgi:alkylation response protein AidB-like acyl-CoA dehydrogenase
MLSEDEKACLARIKAFAAADVAPQAAGWAAGQSPDSVLLAKAAEVGLTRLEVPIDNGGLGFGFALKARACELLAAADFGFAMSMVNSHNVALKLAQCAPRRVAEKYLPALLSGQLSACTALSEPGTGSDFAAIETRARKTSGGWTLDGEKSWIVNARHAGIAVVYAQCSAASGRDGIGAFLVDLTTQDSRRYAVDSTFSQTSTGTGGFVLDGYQVPEENLLLAPGAAFKSILNEINGARAYVAAMCCGMLDAALRQTAAYGESRHTFGAPLSGHQAWRLDQARASTDLAAARALVAQAVQGVAAGQAGRQDVQLLSAQAKIHAVGVCQHHLPVLLHAMGAEGLRPKYSFTRHLAAAQIAALVDGSTEMLLERVARLARPKVSRAITPKG